MNILFAASEMVPFCKTGGLADVIGALPMALAEMGHEVTVMLPGYSGIDRKKFGFNPHHTDLKIPIGQEFQPLTLLSTSWNGVTVYLLEHTGYFDRQALYGDIYGDFGDNGERFTYYSRAVVEAVKIIGIKPDIVHAHDWQTGLVIAYLHTLYANDPSFANTKTLFTIHNLGYQGIFSPFVFAFSGLPWEEFHWKKMEYWDNVSFLKAGIVYADAVSTVSKTYAEEITHENLGFGMHGVLEERKSSLYGIVNGIDTEVWNPATDPHLPANYTVKTLRGKKACRDALLKTCGLTAKPHTPIVGMVSRLDDQKGLDILEGAIEQLGKMDIRLIILGTGTENHHAAIESIVSKYPDRIHAFLRFDDAMAHLIYAGSDAFLMPSRYEPCGLGQLISMRYGTVPIVHATGGLADTVHDSDNNPDTGNGFSFTSYTSDDLVDAIARAVKIFTAPRRVRWKNIQKVGMSQDYSWKVSAQQYIKLYNLMRNQ